MSNTPLPADRWLSVLESRRGLLTGAVLIVCVAMILVTAMRNPVDYDGYWHLRMGMDWVQNGLSPWVDHYSFTYPGASISGIPYMFQVALYGMVSVFGEDGGMIAMKLALFLFIFACMIAWLEQIKAPVLGYLLGMVVLVVAIQQRAQVRPELLSFGLMIVSLMLYRRANLKLTFSAIAPIVLLLVFWANYHSPIFFYVIFFGLFIDIAFRLLTDRAPMSEWVKWAGWGVVLVSTGYLRPSFNHPVFGTGAFVDEWGKLIQEYLPPVALLETPLGPFLIVIALTTWFGLFMQRKWGLLVVASVFVYSACTMGRMVAPATILCACLLPLVLTDWQSRDLSQRKATKSITVYSVILILGSLLLGVAITRSFMKENLLSWTSFPVQIADHIKSTGRSGRILNDYETGGYLIHHLSPDSKVYIDGRTNILYPVDHYLRYLQVRSNPDEFVAETTKYGIEFAIVRADQDTAAIMRLAGWSLDFMDIEFALFQPGNGALDAFGRLWGAPYCWSDTMRQRIKTELSHIRISTGKVLPSTPMMHYALAYASTDNPDELLGTVALSYDHDDAGKRFLAERALSHRKPDAAIQLSGSIVAREPRDDLVPVIAYGLEGRWHEAQAAMEAAAAAPWRIILPSEQQLQLKTLNWLATKQNLSNTLLNWQSLLLQELKQSNLTGAIGSADLCLEATP